MTEEINYKALIDEDVFNAYEEGGAFIQNLEYVIWKTFDNLHEDSDVNCSNVEDVMWENVWDTIGECIEDDTEAEDIVTDYGLSDSFNELSGLVLDFSADISIGSMAFAVIYYNMPEIKDLVKEYKRLYSEEEEEE